MGQTLTASGGSGGYQWYHEGTAISGATSSTYTLQGKDQGDLISVLSGGVFSALVGPVKGTTVFYVSSSTGNDSNPGTLAAPWQTLTKVNGETFSPGTSILFKRGDVFRTGGLGTASGLQSAQLVPQSGSSGSIINYDAYGTGNNPHFMGSVSAASVSDWTNVGGNIWQSTLVFAPPSGNSNGLPYSNACDIGNVFWGTWPNYSWGTMAVECPTVWPQELRLKVGDGMKG